MKRSFLVLVLSFTVILSANAQDSWAGKSAETAKITILNFIKGSARKQYRVFIIYDRTFLTTMENETYITIDVPIGENLFYMYVDNGGYDACLVDAEEGEHYYIMAKKKIDVLSSSGVQTTFRQIDKDVAEDKLAGMIEIKLGD